MKAAVVAIGDELTSGQRIDTNSAWISRRLSELGIPVVVHLTAADDLVACKASLAFAGERADIVVMTGGLGPTADDLTRDALAAATGRGLIVNDKAMTHIEQLYRSRNRTMPESNRRQALFPEGSRVVDNPHGTAPGIHLTTAMSDRSVHWIALPGVPAEMTEMWERSVASELAELAGQGKAIVHRRIKCFGIGESACEELIPDLIARGRHPQVGITVHRATITLRITATGPSRDACLDVMQPTIESIHDRLGDLVFGTEDDELEDVVVRLLAERGSTLAVAETDTQCLLAGALSAANARHGSNVFKGAVSCPGAKSWKELAPGVNGPNDVGLHDPAVVAAWLRRQLGTTHSLAIGPFPNGDENFRIAVAPAPPADPLLIERGFAGHPDIRVARSVKQALDLLRRHLLGLEIS